MPWGPPHAPSTALGTLSSYIKIQRNIEVKTYNAFLIIPSLCAGNDFDHFYKKMINVGENIFFLLYLRRYNKNLFPSVDTNRLMTLIQKKEPWFNEDILDLIEQSTIDYLDNELIPNIDCNKINIVGFSLGHSQTYASIFAYNYFLESLDHKDCPLFVFGGNSLNYDQTRFVLEKLNTQALGVIAEGEDTLVWLIDYIVKHKNLDLNKITKAATNNKLGIINFSSKKTTPIHEIAKTNFDLSRLTTPDYATFFNDINDLAANDDIKQNLLSQYLIMHIEGSRGCAFRCGFCNYTVNMKTHRYHSGDRIYEMLKELQHKYDVKRVQFIDSQADYWAADYCKRMQAENININSIMSLRTTHDFSFYRSLKDVGVEAIIFGFDAFTDNLLKIINKKTTVLDNLKSLKYVNEVGITSMSNIITHYPGATLQDVEATKLLLAKNHHLGPIGTHIYRIGEGSVEHQKIVNITKKRLPALDKFNFPKVVVPYIVGAYCEIPPAFQISSELQNAWEDLLHWYSKYCSSKQFQQATLTIHESPNQAIITDSRGGTSTVLKYHGVTNKILQLTHDGQSQNQLKNKIDANSDELDDAIRELVEKDILLRDNDILLNICIRAKSVGTTV